MTRNLQINVDLGDRGGIAFVLDRLAAVASARGQEVRALRVAGASARLREQAGAPPSSLDQREIDRNLECARRALGRFAQDALEEGRKLSLTDVLAEAHAMTTTTNDHDSVSGGAVLSSREREVAAPVASGQTNRRIGTQLMVAEGTVATHVQHILAKLELQSRAQIAAWAVREALLKEPDSQNGVDHAVVPG